MDIPVSRLNQRMALQLPAELPLGLVFVVGEIHLPEAAKVGQPRDFYLGDSEYRLPCRLSERAAAEFQLNEGDEVRAGGHLVFEPAWASYYLLARDIEHLNGVRPPAKPLAAIIADNNRREQAVSLMPAELPSWVQQMAPPELQPQQAGQRLAAATTMMAPEMGGDWELLAEAEAAVAYPEAEPALAGLSDDLIAFLSQAMDSDVEVEITSEILTDLNTTGTTDRLSPELLEALDVFEASVSQVSHEPAETVEPDLDGDHLDDGHLDARRLDDRPMPASQNGKPTVAVDGHQPEESALTAAEVTMVLESAAEGDLPAATGAVNPVEPEIAVGADHAEAARPTGKHKADRPAKSQRNKKTQSTVPWYVAALVIIVFVILLIALVVVVLFPESLPIELPLDLARELPILDSVLG